MRRFLLGFFLLIYSFGLSQDLPQDSLLYKKFEHILSYHSYIEVAKDASVTVTEKIRVYATGNNIRRGIFRSLPTSRYVKNRNERVKYDIISVKINGTDEDYHTEHANGNLVIYIGNKNVLLENGLYEYEIIYKSKNQVSFFDKYDELYWNVNGNSWNFTADKVSARVQLPNGAEILQNSCYTGNYGSKVSNCSSKILSKNLIEWSSESLGQNEGLTVAVGFSKGTVTEPPPPGFLEKYGLAAFMLITMFGLMYYFYTTWQKYGIDPQKPVIYPQFNAPKNLSPASIGYINDAVYSNSLLSAALVNLAVKGFIQIEEKGGSTFGIFGRKTYTLKKLKNQNDSLPKEEINLMNRLFGNSDIVELDGKYSSTIENAVKDFKGSLSFQHSKFLQEGNNSSKLILPTLVILILYAFGIIISFLSTYSEGHLVAGIFLGVSLPVISIFFMYFFERYVASRWLGAIVAAGLLFILMLSFASDDRGEQHINFYACYLFIIVGCIGMVMYQFLIKKPTPEKLETQSLIDGFKLYLGAAEEKTLQFHNPPQMTPQFFEKMLPYAMVFGVDKIWGDKFQKALKNAAVADQNYNATWYVGNTPMNFAFASTLNTSLSQSIASSATQPSSSSSGSGGGGFSGGGGGGGGGGGW